MRRQLKTMGAMCDWASEVITCRARVLPLEPVVVPAVLEHGPGLSPMAPVDWCPKDQASWPRTGAGTDRLCWRCGTPVIKRDLEQWFFRITEYADELLDFDGIDWPEPIKVHADQLDRAVGGRRGRLHTRRRHHAGGEQIRVFTTRPDTLFGATFMVLAPEHPLVDALTAPEQRAAVEAYRADQPRRKTEIERLSTDREKTGVALGAYAINPVNGERMPIWIADYVLAGYGTGAIMAVPAHDERDFEFAGKFGLPIRRVVAAPRRGDGRAHGRGLLGAQRRRDPGQLGPLQRPARRRAARPSSPTAGAAARASRTSPTACATGWSAASGHWGTPIPVVYCDTDGIVPVPDDQLPVVLPDDFDYSCPGRQPAAAQRRLRATRPARSAAARPGARRTPWTRSSTQPGIGGATCRRNKEDGPIDRERWTTHWCPVDQYTGGAEHAVMHLLYARFFTKALNDMGIVKEREPLKRLFNQGQILGEDGERMSKIRGNVQDPDELVDALRRRHRPPVPDVHGPVGSGRAVESEGHRGRHRFLRRVWTVAAGSERPGGWRRRRRPTARRSNAAAAADELRRAAHRTLKKVTEDHDGSTGTRWSRR